MMFLEIKLCPFNIPFNMMFQVLKQLNLPLQLSLSDDKGDLGKAKVPWEIIPVGHKIGTPVPLFKELVNCDLYIFSSLGLCGLVTTA